MPLALQMNRKNNTFRVFMIHMYIKQYLTPHSTINKTTAWLTEMELYVNICVGDNKIINSELTVR